MSKDTNVCLYKRQIIHCRISGVSLTNSQGQNFYLSPGGLSADNVHQTTRRQRQMQRARGTGRVASRGGSVARAQPGRYGGVDDGPGNDPIAEHRVESTAEVLARDNPDAEIVRYENIT